MDGGGDHVDGGLAEADTAVGVYEAVAAAGAEAFVRTGGDKLISVRVCRGARARMEDVGRKPVVELAGRYFARRLLVITFEEASGSDIEAALDRASQAFEAWRPTSFEQRGELMRAAAGVLRRDKARLGRLITLEMGKPIVEAEAEVEKCAWACDYFGENAA